MNNNERLRRLLREADPAAGEPGLPPEEVQAMRRAVLTSVPEPKRRWIPIAALAGSVLAAILLAVLLLRPDAKGPATPRQPARIAEKPKSMPAPVPVPPPPAPEPVVEEPERPRETRAPRKRPEPAPVAVAEAAPETLPQVAPEPAPVVPEAEATIAAETRQIQFSTPGGTRIIWVLTADGASH